MDKKLQNKAEAGDMELMDAVRHSAHEIWQAGLGAFAKAREEGSDVFTRLVKEGNDLQSRTHEMTGEKLSEMSDAVAKMAATFSKQATDSLGKMEEALEERIVRALRGMGVTTQHDVKALASRIEELSNEVKALAPKRKAAAKKTVAAKSATAKKAAGAKAPAKRASAAVAGKHNGKAKPGAAKKPARAAAVRH